jgi:hypothetical protein
MARLVRSTRVPAWTLIALAACVAVVSYTTVARSASQPVVRTVYGTSSPENAPGQSLALQQVVIAPGAKLAEHFHEGTQLATIRTGVLTYNVVSGAVSVTHPGGKAETVTGPAVVKLQKGDTIVETESLVHYGANQGKVPVVIELASLLRAGAPLSTPVGQGDAGLTPLDLRTVLASQSRTLRQVGATSQFTYGWNQLTGTATSDAGPVAVELLGAVDYQTGAGPFSGFVTYSWSDGSTLAVRMQGLARAGSDGSTTFSATLGVIGGTGRYATATGTGVFTGSRTTALGGNVDSTFALRLGH